LQGTPPPETSNNFPGSSAAAITAVASLATAAWYLDGGGVFRLPRFTPAQRLASPTAGDLQFDPSTGAGSISVYDGSAYNRMPRDDWARGGEGLRDAMWAMAASTSGRFKAQNYPIWGIPGASSDSTSLGLTNTRNYYLAIYWPGGNCTGVDWIQSINGSYTDTGPAHSGWQIMGGSATTPVISSTTALTRITGTNNVLASNPSGGAFSSGTGHRTRDFSGGVVNMPAGIYYVNFFWARTAVTTIPQLQGMSISGADYVNDNTTTNSRFTPAGFPMQMATAGGSGDADLVTPVTISTLNTTTTNVLWVGLH
jgi:hypothetical protein